MQLPHTFVIDAQGERQVARLRLLGAFVVFASGAWLLAEGATGARLALVVLSWPAVLFWVRSHRITLRRNAAATTLTLDGDGLVLTIAGERTQVAWSVVESVRVDEDRLVVCVVRRGDSPLVIEPIWAGGSVYALAEAVAGARAQHAASGGPGPAAGLSAPGARENDAPDALRA